MNISVTNMKVYSAVQLSTSRLTVVFGNNERQRISVVAIELLKVLKIMDCGFPNLRSKTLPEVQLELIQNRHPKSVDKSAPNT